MSIALLSVAINNLAKAVRWQIMLAATGKPLRLSRVFMIILVGQALNLFLPGPAGDFIRAVAVGHSVSGSIFALGTIALEKILDLVCYAFLFMWILLVLPMPAWFQNSGYTLAALPTTLLGLVFLFIISLSNVPQKSPHALEQVEFKVKQGYEG